MRIRKNYFTSLLISWFQLKQCMNKLHPQKVILLCAMYKRYTIFFYDHTSPCATVNDVHKDCLMHKGRNIGHISSTGNALHQHVKRAASLLGHCWGKSLEVPPQIPSPSEWVGEPTQRWEPIWTTEHHRAVKGSVLADVIAFVRSCFVQPSTTVGDFAAGVNE